MHQSGHRDTSLTNSYGCLAQHTHSPTASPGATGENSREKGAQSLSVLPRQGPIRCCSRFPGN